MALETIHSQPVLRDHLRPKNWLLNTGDSLIQVHLHCDFVQRTAEGRWSLNRGDHISRFDCITVRNAIVFVLLNLMLSINSISYSKLVC